MVLEGIYPYWILFAGVFTKGKIRECLVKLKNALEARDGLHMSDLRVILVQLGVQVLAKNIRLSLDVRGIFFAEEGP